MLCSLVCRTFSFLLAGCTTGSTRSLPSDTTQNRTPIEMDTPSNIGGFFLSLFLPKDSRDTRTVSIFLPRTCRRTVEAFCQREEVCNYIYTLLYDTVYQYKLFVTISVPWNTDQIKLNAHIIT